MRESHAELLRRIQRSEDGSIEFKEAVFSGGKIKGPELNDLADENVPTLREAGTRLVLTRR